MKIEIKTDQAPLPFGTYSQAVRVGNLLFVSGQLPMKAGEMNLISENPKEQLLQCFENIKNICLKAGANLNDAVKINVYYTNQAISDILNEVMEDLFSKPYPARVRIKVAGLSRNAKVEIDGVFLCQN